ncbi:MAG: hypothetical protein M3163_00265 [Actinomycetota bacterium]|nr:hypothetical protein [Actinomycetota bacterium]
MSSRQDPAEQLLDLLVYAPLGLLLEARDLVPKLADKGRQRMGGQVTVARMIGEMAVRQGQRRAEKVVQRMREQQRGGGADRPTAGSGSESDRPANGHRPASPPAGATATAPTDTVPEVDSLAIPGYDTLSASQVVPRLEGLSPDELDAIRAYEVATRARKTVLTRVDQLRGTI